MAERLKRSGLAGSTNHIAVGAGDARTGLGYGTLSPKFQLPRSSNSQYPYTDEDPYENIEIDFDDSTASSVNKKSLNYVPIDSLAAKSVDQFYFAGGNTKLSDCFWRIDKILAEVSAFGDSMSSVPQLNSPKGPSMSGYSSFGPFQGAGGTSYRRTGTLQGWSKAPPPVDVQEEEDLDAVEKEDDTYTLEDIAKKHQFDVGFLDFHDT